MKKDVILPILARSSNQLVLKLIAILFMFSLISVFFNIFIWNSIFFYYFAIGLMILSGIVIQVFNIYRQIGTLKLNDFFITVNNKEIIPIQDINNLKICINGYEGRRGLDNLRSFYSDDGKNNYIEFNFLNSHRKFKVFVSFQNHDILVNLIELWQNKGVVLSKR